MGFWSIVGLGFIATQLVLIGLLVVALFRKSDELERWEDEQAERRVTAAEVRASGDAGNR